jgi:hypothetical protein
MKDFSRPKEIVICPNEKHPRTTFYNWRGHFVLAFPPSYTPITMFTINILFVYISCILHIYVKNVIKMYSYFAIWKKSQNEANQTF